MKAGRGRAGRRWCLVVAVVATGCGSAASSSLTPATPGTLASVESVASQVPIVPVAPTARDLAALADKPATRVDPPLRRATFAFTGDTLPHRPVIDSAQRNGGGAYDFAPIFARIAPIISWADFGICHLETPVAPDGEELSPAPRYGVPKEIAGGIASAGYDRCSTASNHSLDRGTKGIDATVTALEQAGLSQAGMARTPEEAAAPNLIEVNGITVAHLSYTWYFNGLPLPEGQPWRSNLIDPQRIRADALRSRGAGAQVVIVSLHWGNEGDLNITAYQRDVAQQVMSSGLVDLIVGHHAHVVQPIEQVAGKWVVFGMGNILSNMPTGAVPGDNTQDGIVVTVAIQENADGTFAIERPVVYPTWVDRDHNHVIRPVLQDLADPATSPFIVAALRVSLQRTTRVVGDFIFKG